MYLINWQHTQQKCEYKHLWKRKSNRESQGTQAMLTRLTLTTMFWQQGCRKWKADLMTFKAPQETLITSNKKMKKKKKEPSRASKRPSCIASSLLTTTQTKQQSLKKVKETRTRFNSRKRRKKITEAGRQLSGVTYMQPCHWVRDSMKYGQRVGAEGLIKKTPQRTIEQKNLIKSC